MEFEELGISNELVQKLSQHGITEPTQIQQKTIPLIANGRDVLAEAETGSGKTLAFGLHSMETVSGSDIKTVILSPTRELARQVAKEFEKFGGSNIETALIYGGVGYDRQIQEARKANICVGTPGRILDLLKRGDLDFSHAETFILDEADRLLDMGFIDDIEKIMSFCPDNTQNLFFSATLPSSLRRLYEKHTENAETVKIERKHHTRNLTQRYCSIRKNQKLSVLYTLLQDADGLSLVFCRTKSTTRFVAKVLRHNGINARALNGDLSQNKREKVVRNLKNENLQVVVATDVAARGLHIDNISHVFNYDVPDTPETYTHRIGRTGRMGSQGDAITLLSENDHQTFRRIHQENRKALERMQPPENLQRVKMPKRKNRKRRR